jgi:hypothetical protein
MVDCLHYKYNILRCGYGRLSSLRYCSITYTTRGTCNKGNKKSDIISKVIKDSPHHALLIEFYKFLQMPMNYNDFRKYFFLNKCDKILFIYLN